MNGHYWKVCYAVRRNGTVREMPAVGGFATRESAEAYANARTAEGYVHVHVSPETVG